MTKYARDTDYPKPPRWGRLYDRFFPLFTCGSSRHVKCHAESLRSVNSPMRRLLMDAGYEPDHIAASLEVTVQALWKARAEIEKLKREKYEEV